MIKPRRLYICVAKTPRIPLFQSNLLKRIRTMLKYIQQYLYKATQPKSISVHVAKIRELTFKCIFAVYKGLLYLIKLVLWSLQKLYIQD